MIVRLYADSDDPVMFRDQVNASLAELATAMENALIGEVIRYTGAGVYAHKLGVVPAFGLVTVSNLTTEDYGIVTMDESGNDWNESTVYIGNLDPDGGSTPSFTQILLVGKP